MAKKFGFSDSDDTALNYLPFFLKYRNKIMGTNYRKRDIWTFELWKVMNCGKEQSISETYGFYFEESGDFQRLPPYKDAVRGIDLLSQKYKIEILTARPDTTASITKKNIEMHFKGKIENIIHTNEYMKGRNNGYNSKADICEKFCPEFIIDDSLKNCIECANRGVRVVMMSQPWNLIERPIPLPSNMSIAKNWKEVVEQLL
jgi:hypothetical protein